MSAEDLLRFCQRGYEEFWSSREMLRIGMNGDRESTENWLTQVYLENGYLNCVCVC